jgi:hypothetical protein
MEKAGSSNIKAAGEAESSINFYRVYASLKFHTYLKQNRTHELISQPII